MARASSVLRFQTTLSALRLFPSLFIRTSPTAVTRSALSSYSTRSVAKATSRVSVSPAVPAPLWAAPAGDAWLVPTGDLGVFEGLVAGDSARAGSEVGACAAPSASWVAGRASV